MFMPSTKFGLVYQHNILTYRFGDVQQSESVGSRVTLTVYG